MKNSVLILISLLAVLCVCDASKILFISPVPGKSHGILGYGLVKPLLDAGHEVTHVTAIPSKDHEHPKHHQIDVSENFKIFEGLEDTLNIKSLMDGNSNMDESSTLMETMIFIPVFSKVAEMTFQNEKFQKILQDPNQHFDLVIAEWLFADVYAGLGNIYGAPVIWLSTIEPNWMIFSLVDEYLNPSYNGYDVDVMPPFSFTQRLRELRFTVLISVFRETYGRFISHKIYNHHLVPLIEARGKIAPSFQEVRYNASLILGNSHVSMGQATRLPQSYKPIGGYHIDDKVKPLPEDLKKIFENAKDGVIYFSMGSNLKSKDMPDELKRNLIKMFGSLKQTVLWKFEEDFTDLPKNVQILKWAPQQSILAHPKCVLFITHGGLLSTTETIHHGVPIIGIPVFADQFTNVARAVSKGFALKVSLSYSMVENLKANIQEILNNPKYSQKAKELSFIYHDRPVPPAKELVHWVEHVVKTGGAPHLRSPALMLPWYQKCYLDLVALIVAAILVLRKVFSYVKSQIFPKKLDSNKKRN